MTNPFNPGTAEREEWERQQRLNTGIELHRGQLRFAERMVDAYAHRMRFVYGLGWHVWDGQRWALDVEGHAARAVVDILKGALRDIADMDNAGQRQALLNDVRGCEKSTGINGILDIARRLRPFATSPKHMDADPWLFNVQNGTLDLRTGEIRKHNPEDLITKIAGCGLNPYAVGPQFEAFITEILPDDDVRQYVQRLLGSAMYGGIRDHVLPIFTGTGANGKSTLVELARAVFGSYSIAAEPELLVDRSGAHTTGQADLLGVRLATTMETDSGRRLATATVKRLTGGDKIRARRMRQDFFEFDPSHTLVMVTNKLPQVAGDDAAIWRRIQVVPFDVAIPPDKVDDRLGEKLQLEMTYVLQWIWNGYRQWNEGGLQPPEAVRLTTSMYRTESDTVTRFTNDRCMTSPAGVVRAAELWTEYRSWCDQAGEKPVTQKQFSESLRANGFEHTRRKIGMVYTGLYLLTDLEEPNDEGR